MQDITELQGRLSGALDRISRGLEGLGRVDDAAGSSAGRDVQALEDRLADERDLTAQMQEQLRAGRADHEAKILAMEAELAETRALLASVEEDRARLKAASDALRASCETLRSAQAEGVADADLINGAMKDEIATLTATRQSDRSELEAIIGLLSDEEGERRHG